MRWLASQLPTWAARCASADGSADDTTIALLVSAGGQTAPDVTLPGGMAGSTAVDLDPGSDEITIPAHIQAGQVTTEHMTTEEIAAADIANQVTADWEPPWPSTGSSIR
jgi:hypothetical protein